MTEPSILTVTNLTKKFGGLTAVDNVSFSVRAGEILGIIGPNGAGKSTLLKLILGLLRPSSGTIIFRGHDVTHHPPYHRTRLGLSATFQHPLLLWTDTALTNVLAGLVWQKAPLPALRERARDVLTRFGLDTLQNTPARDVNLAYQQLTQVARASAPQPSLLVLDEPFAPLSDSQIGNLVEVLLEFRTTCNLTIVIVEHRIKHLLAICDRLLVLHAGRVLTSGSPHTVVTDPKVIEVYLGHSHNVAGGHDAATD